MHQWIYLIFFFATNFQAFYKILKKFEHLHGSLGGKNAGQIRYLGQIFVFGVVFLGLLVLLSHELKSEML